MSKTTKFFIFFKQVAIFGFKPATHQRQADGRAPDQLCTEQIWPADHQQLEIKGHVNILNTFFFGLMKNNFKKK